MSKMWIGIAAAVAVAALVVTVAWVAMMPPANGSLAVAVHDAPCAECSHVWVTFSSVAVHESNVSGAGWTTLNVSGLTVDLAQLNGSALAKTIGVLSLPAGHYEQIRLALSSVVIQLVGTNSNLTASLGGSGQAVIPGQFNVTSGATTTVCIDIDLGSSVHLTGNGGVVFTPNIGTVTVS